MVGEKDESRVEELEPRLNIRERRSDGERKKGRSVSGVLSSR